MAKIHEKKYFKSIGQEGVDFTIKKPFSDNQNVGALLSDIAAIFTLLPKAPAKLLDLGCGSGWTSNFFSQAGYQVVGIDISKEAIDAAKSSFEMINSSLRFECADYDNIKYINEFDIAVFFDSLHHSDDEDVALRSAYKALKKGGMIVLCEPGRGHSKSPSSVEAVDKFGVSERDMPPKISKQALQKAGFLNIKVFAYPAISHRVSYKTFEGTKKQLTNFSIVRGMILFALNTFLKNNHGIVVAYKTE